MTKLVQQSCYFKEQGCGHDHYVRFGAPCEWSAERGATHTLLLPMNDETRPAKVFRTIAFIGVDEDEYGEIVWEKWNIKIHYCE